MFEMKDMFKSSSKELKKVSNLCICALLMALSVVISTLTIRMGDYVNIGFSFLASDLVYLMFGPVVGMVFAGVGDIIKYFINPTGPFNPAFTLIAILAGLIYGVCWYKKPLSFMRVLIAKGIVALVLNIFLNTLFLSLMYGNAFFAILPIRALKNVIMLPINSVLFFTFAKTFEKAKNVVFSNAN